MPAPAAAPVAAQASATAASGAAAQVLVADAPSSAGEKTAAGGSEQAGAMAVTEDAGGEHAANPAAKEPIQHADTRPGRDEGKAFQRKAQRRLGGWHRQIVAAWEAFDQLDEEGLHSLRKRIKRQRYAVEFFAPVLRRRDVDRYLKTLTSIQDRMGELNDLFVARTRYQALIATDPAAWFALGWLAARVVEVRTQARPELKLLAKAEPPAR